MSGRRIGFWVGLVVCLIVAAAVWFWPRGGVIDPGLFSGEIPQNTTPEPAASGHPLEPALKIAREGLASIRENVRDYTAVITKREMVGGTLYEEKMFAKIRNRKVKDGKTVVPLSVYLMFLEPPSSKGREVIWVEGRHEGKLIAHEGGFKNLIRSHLDPKGFLAMMGNRYPISEIGMENLVEKLVIKGEQGLKHDDVQVSFFDDQDIGGRKCKLIKVMHPEKKPEFDFHIAQIHIDQQRNIPLRYAAYDWPAEDGGEPTIIEHYTYEDVKLNVGLTEKDFDPDNDAYKFP